MNTQDLLQEVQDKLAFMALAVLAFANADEGLRPQEKELTGLWRELKHTEKLIAQVQEQE